MNRLLVPALAALVLLFGMPSETSAIPHRKAALHAAPDTIPKLVGSVGPTNAAWFLDQVAGQLDKIVGLQVYIEPGTDAEFEKSGYLVDATSEPFSLSRSDPKDVGGGIELVAPRKEANWQHGGWVVDGFYLVKGGGVHQGTVSVGLEKVSEAEVLLSPKFRVVTRDVKSK